jgi:uncharacterized phage protein gp47/JayE
MAELPNRAALFEVFADEILTRADLRPVGDRITPEQVRTPGSDINLIGAGASAMGEEVVRQLGLRTNNLTLDGATGDDLDRWVADRYSPLLARRTASPAVGQLTFTRTSTALGAVTYTAGSIVQSTGGVRFEVLADAAFGALGIGPTTVACQAVEAGASGNVAANTVTGFVTAPPDSSMAVTNSETMAGGDSTESDESLRSRARLFYEQARRGILAAIEFGALTVPGINQATAEEVLNSLGVPNGFVNCYIADANGQSNTTLNGLVENALLEYRAGGVVVDVFGAVPTYQAISLDLSYLAGTDTAAAFAQVVATIVANVNGLAPNETLEVSLIMSAARSVSGVIVADDAVVVPTGDVVPSAGQVMRTRSDLVTQAVT